MCTKHAAKRVAFGEIAAFLCASITPFPCETSFLLFSPQWYPT